MGAVAGRNAAARAKGIEVKPLSESEIHSEKARLEGLGVAGAGGGPSMR